MAQIIFEKLTVEEEKNARGGTVIAPSGSGCQEGRPFIACPPLEQ